MKYFSRLLGPSFFQLSHGSVRVIRRDSGVTFRPARPVMPRLNTVSRTPASKQPAAGWPKPLHRWMF